MKRHRQLNQLPSRPNVLTPNRQLKEQPGWLTLEGQSLFIPTLQEDRCSTRSTFHNRHPIRWIRSTTVQLDLSIFNTRVEMIHMRLPLRFPIKNGPLQLSTRARFRNLRHLAVTSQCIRERRLLRQFHTFPPKLALKRCALSRPSRRWSQRRTSSTSYGKALYLRR